MNLYALVVTDPSAPRGLATWYFSSHAQFLAAKRLAQQHGIFVHEHREFICDANEFRDWLSSRKQETT